MTETPENSASELSTLQPVVDEPDSSLSRREKILRNVGWVTFAIFLLIFFTLLKLPTDPLKGYAESMISAQLAPRGVSFSAKESKLSILLWPTLSFQDATFSFSPPTPPGKLEHLSFSPAIFSFIFGNAAGSFQAKTGNGTLSGSFSTPMTQKYPAQVINATLDAKTFDLGRSGFLSLAAGIQGSGTITGTTSLAGDLNSPSTLEGSINLQLSKVQIEAQSYRGFPIPKISISEGSIDVTFTKGKATIKTLRLGKTGNTSDDLQGTATGDFTLGKTWESSSMSLKTHFSVSEKLLKAFFILEAILGSGKQADGSFSFNLIGSVMNPTPVPLPGGG